MRPLRQCVEVRRGGLRDVLRVDAAHFLPDARQALIEPPSHRPAVRRDVIHVLLHDRFQGAIRRDLCGQAGRQGALCLIHNLVETVALDVLPARIIDRGGPLSHPRFNVGHDLVDCRGLGVERRNANGRHGGGVVLNLGRVKDGGFCCRGFGGNGDGCAVVVHLHAAAQRHGPAQVRCDVAIPRQIDQRLFAVAFCNGLVWCAGRADVRRAAAEIRERGIHGALAPCHGQIFLRELPHVIQRIVRVRLCSAAKAHLGADAGCCAADDAGLNADVEQAVCKAHAPQAEHQNNQLDEAKAACAGQQYRPPGHDPNRRPEG